MPREQINKLCNSYAMEHHTVKKNNVQLNVTTQRNLKRVRTKKSQSTQSLHYRNIKNMQNKTTQCLGTHALLTDCKGK